MSADPILNEYLSVKPAGGIYTPNNLNLYHYCNNNPVIYIDPTGMVWTDSKGNELSKNNLKNVKVYIFHDNDFKKQAMKQYKMAEKKYGKGSVALSNTGTTSGFSQDWGIWMVKLKVYL